MRRLFRRRVEPVPPPGATPDEAATQPITAVREEEVVAPPRRPPRIWPWLLALLVLVLAGISAAYLLTRDDEDSGPETVTVPDVVGMRVEFALRRLGTEALAARVARASSERPAGVVVSQRPPPGTNLDPGGTVTLVASEGPRTVEVPNVVGIPLAQAFRRLEAAQLRPQARRVFSPKARGRVLKQRPAAGAELEREQVVLLTVSKGPGRVAVPDLVGLSEAEAATRLTSAGLGANVVRVASSEPAGTVVAQNPVPGERVRRSSPVRLNVSKGTSATTTATTTATATTTTATASSAATVPDVVGLDEPTAQRQLRQAGFAVRSVSRNTTDPAQDGIVLEQRPAGSSPARAGSQVTITVGVLSP